MLVWRNVKVVVSLADTKTQEPENKPCLVSVWIFVEVNMNGEHLTRDIQGIAGDLKKNLSEKSEVIDKTRKSGILFMLSFCLKSQAYFRGQRSL